MAKAQKAKKKPIALKPNMFKEPPKTKTIKCQCGKTEVTVGLFAANKVYCDECRPMAGSDPSIKLPSRAVPPPVYVVDLSEMTQEGLLELFEGKAISTPSGGVYLKSDDTPFRFMFGALVSGWRWITVWNADNESSVVGVQAFMTDPATKSDPLAKYVRERLRTVAKVIQPKAS